MERLPGIIGPVSVFS